MKKFLNVGAFFATLMLIFACLTSCSNNAEGSVSIWKIKGDDGLTHSTLYFYEDGTWKCTGDSGLALSGYSGTYTGDTTANTGTITLTFSTGYTEYYSIDRDRGDVWLTSDRYAYIKQ